MDKLQGGTITCAVPSTYRLCFENGVYMSCSPATRSVSYVTTCQDNAKNSTCGSDMKYVNTTCYGLGWLSSICPGTETYKVQ